MFEGLNPQGYDQYGFTEDGYDADFCNFHFHGPFAPLQSFQIFQILRQQTKPFLMSLSRTCPGLSAVPDIWLKQTWVTERKVIAGERKVIAGERKVTAVERSLLRSEA